MPLEITLQLATTLPVLEAVTTPLLVSAFLVDPPVNRQLQQIL
jgi:hypothetical protein